LCLTTVEARSHADITLEEWQSESKGQQIFLDMYAEW